MDSEGQIKNIVLKRMNRCVVCHREFNTDDIHVLSRKSDIWTMLVECDDCHARNFVAAVLNDGDPQEAQLALRRLTADALTAIHLLTMLVLKCFWMNMEVLSRTYGVHCRTIK